DSPPAQSRFLRSQCPLEADEISGFFFPVVWSWFVIRQSLRFDLLDFKVQVLQTLIQLFQNFRVPFSESCFQLPRSCTRYSSPFEEEHVRCSLDLFIVVGWFVLYFARIKTSFVMGMGKLSGDPSRGGFGLAFGTRCNLFSPRCTFAYPTLASNLPSLAH